MTNHLMAVDERVTEGLPEDVGQMPSTSCIDPLP